MYRAGIVFGEFGVAGEFIISDGIVGLGTAIFADWPRVVLMVTILLFSLRISVGIRPEEGLI